MLYYAKQSASSIQYFLTEFKIKNRIIMLILRDCSRKMRFFCAAMGWQILSVHNIFSFKLAIFLKPNICLC